MKAEIGIIAENFLGLLKTLPNETCRTDEVRQILSNLEWADDIMWQGHNMGDLGPMIPRCPSCRGVHRRGQGHFFDSVIGHRDNCELVAAIAKYGETQ